MPYLRWLGRVLWFAPAFAVAVVKANVQMAGDILTPGSHISGGFVEVPLRCRTDFEIAVLANMITLTPGTATVAVHRASSTLWVQGLYLDEPDDLRRSVRELEDMLLGATRASGPPQEHPPLGAWRKEQQP